MGRPLVIPQPPAGDFLSADEFIGALEALSPEEKLKLADIEALRRGGTEFTPGELVQEAICRTLAGERNCPRGVPFMAFMAQTMRSIASHDRLQRGRESSFEEMQAAGNATADGAADPPAVGPSPEDQLMQEELIAAVRAIHGHFDDDQDAQLVLLGWQDDLGGAALREATGLGQGQLDYAIRRIRTRMRKAYPRGWMT